MSDGSETAAWLYYADGSYVSTRMLWFTGLTLDSSIFGHRTLELYMKGFLVSVGAEVKPSSSAWGHDLGALGKAGREYNREFGGEDVMRRLCFFDRYFNYIRYPGGAMSPDDGSLTWFAFDANIGPLDELVAFIRPRIRLCDEEWGHSLIRQILCGADGYKRKALRDKNPHIGTIDCATSGDPPVIFDPSFPYDRPGC
jgi:hypothetical protein